MTLFNAVKYLAIASTVVVAIAFIYGAIHFWVWMVWLMICVIGSMFFMNRESQYTTQHNTPNVPEEDTSGFGFLSTLGTRNKN